MVHKIVVIDNGGATIKAGFAGEDKPRCVLPNCTAKPKADKRTYIGNQLDDIDDISALTLRRPVEKGFVINWDKQREIWTHLFKHVLKVKPEDCSLVITEPLFALPAISETQSEVILDGFRFRKVYTGNCPAFAMRWACSVPRAVAEGASHGRGGVQGLAAAEALCGVVLDCGFSFTHVAPMFDGAVLEHAVKRINLGGKALTNFLKELVSFRAWNMMDEYLIIEDVKEKTCYVASDVEGSLKEARKAGMQNSVRREYVLPDGVTHKRGHVVPLDQMSNPADKKRKRPADQPGKKEPELQVLTLTNERFMVPEALFHPSDIGIEQAGVAEALVQAVECTHPHLHELLYSNVVLIGGNTLFPGFADRVYADLRPLVPDAYALNVTLVDEPITAAWRGASKFAASKDFDQLALTRKDIPPPSSRASKPTAPGRPPTKAMPVAAATH